jgi:hypothetical protein
MDTPTYATKVWFYVTAQTKVTPDTETNISLGFPSEGFTRVNKTKNGFWVYWKYLGNLPTGQGIGTLRKFRIVKPGQIFAPFPLSFYRIVEDETGVYLEKLEQSLEV